MMSGRTNGFAGKVAVGCWFFVSGFACVGPDDPSRLDGAARDGGATDARAAGDATDGGVPPLCTFSVKAELSPRIATVGIVTWTSDLADIEKARIDFGPTTSYGMTAPVDLREPDHRTLLLGMRQRTDYHFRITISKGTLSCDSPDHTIATGSLFNGLPVIDVTEHSSAAAPFGGFFIAGQFVPLGDSLLIPAYIVDAEGQMVWAYGSEHDVTGVAMSYDGKAIWLGSVNYPDSGASVHRVSMDGLVDDDFSDAFAGQSHQLTVLPDETVAFYAQGANGCDDIKEFAPATRTVRWIANAGEAQGGGIGFCHVNNIQYSAEDDTLVFSDLVSQAVVKIRRKDGAMVWVVNGRNPTIGGASWRGNQHGIHLLGVDRFLLFANNSSAIAQAPDCGGTGDGSIALELALDLAAQTASVVWSYKADPGIQNDLMGDVQRLPNGNTLVGYSTKSVLHEVAPDGTLLREWTWPLGATFGYFQQRATLYGPPPR